MAIATMTQTREASTGALAGKVALVTGASRGIGAAIALHLAAAGSGVAINYATNARLAEDVKDQICAAGTEGDVITVQADVSDENQALALVEQTIAHFGRLDILVNNAGITRDRTVRKMSPSEWREVIETNLNGAYYCVHAATPHLIARGQGQIVNISSVIALSGNVGQANYAAAKAGLIGLTKTLALEFARHNITVNCVAPGFIETDMLAPVPDEAKARIRERIPLSRFGTPDDVARAVRFLCTEGDYITGEVLSVNGGLYM
ncbi:MAG TPA: beta-ketoacyl-ACP reductase [Chloroflexota bacterium]|nr:beta-ketoacyl-ACP reductase [Chloroflexota bacterium]